MILGSPGSATFKLACLIWLIAGLCKFSGHRPGALRRSSLRSESAGGIHLPRRGPAPQWRSLRLAGRLVGRIGWRTVALSAPGRASVSPP